MGHVLNEAENLRQQRRASAMIEYADIIQRYDAPKPDEPARLLELMYLLGLSRSECALHIEGVEECRHLSRQITLLKHEQATIAETVERAKTVAAGITAAAASDWTNREARDAMNNKMSAMENDLAAVQGRLNAMRSQLVTKMRGLPLVYSQAHVQAA